MSINKVIIVQRRSFAINLYYNYEKYPLSPLKLRSLALIEQYLPNISDPVYSVHQSFMWFLWLNWRKSTFYPVTAPNDSKCWPIVTSSIQEPIASNFDVTMTDCSRVVAMDAFLAYFLTPVFQRGASLVYIIGKWSEISVTRIPWKELRFGLITKNFINQSGWVTCNSCGTVYQRDERKKCTRWTKSDVSAWFA